MSANYAAYDNVLRDDTGRAIVNAEIYVYRADTGTLAQLYDLAGNPVGQPLSTDQHGGIDNGSTHSAEARQGFRAPGGRYLIRSFKNGVEGRRIPAVMIGTAAAHDVTTERTDTTPGRVMKVGDWGLGGESALAIPGSDLNNAVRGGLYRDGGVSANRPSGFSYGSLLSIPFIDQYTTQLAISFGERVFVRTQTSSVWSAWREFYTTLNTTVDGNGHLLVASPIIRLYDDRIEVEGNFHQPPQFERQSKGLYEIRGTLGLRIDDGWYLETPTDRNGNKYFNVDWEQDVEPENEAGIVEEPVSVVLRIRTYERVWNPQTGRYENGPPVDINDHQARHIALRFNELRRPEPDPEEEPASAE